MAIQILKHGIMDTLQDKGRYGFQHIGIPVCGYLDYISAQLANYIVGNPLAAPIFELNFPASKFTFDDDHTICISGANFVPVLNDKSVPMNKAIDVHKNDQLQFMQPLIGKTTYVAIDGKINGDTWLNSQSYFSKQIKTNHHFNVTKWEMSDKINNHLAVEKKDTTSVIDKIQKHIFDSHEIRFIPGPQWNELTATSILNLLHQPFSTKFESNRMGYKLNGPSLQLNDQRNYLSSAVTRGTIQLLPNGDLIILMADHQTIGGYANLGQIILVDLPKLVQLKNNTPFQFSLTNIETAHKEFNQIQTWFS